MKYRAFKLVFVFVVSFLMIIGCTDDNNDNNKKNSSSQTATTSTESNNSSLPNTNQIVIPTDNSSANNEDDKQPTTPSPTPTPTPSVSIKAEKTTIEVGEIITLKADIKNINVVSYEWKNQNGDILGKGQTLKYEAKEEGTDTIKLIVTDNKGNKLNSTITIKKLPHKLTDEDLDYTITAYCASNRNIYAKYRGFYPSSGKLEKEPSYQATSADIKILDNSLKEIENIHISKISLSNYNTFASTKEHTQQFFPSSNKEENYKLIMKHKDKNLLITCNYENYKKIKQTSSLFVPLWDKKAWIKKPISFVTSKDIRNDRVLYVNYLTDLYFKILKKNIKNSTLKDAMDKTENFMKKNFSNLPYTYKSLSLSQYHHCDFLRRKYELDDKNSDLIKAIQNIFEIAMVLADYKIDLTNYLIADEYKNLEIENNRCDKLEICAQYFVNYLTPLTKNINFTNELDSWEKIEEFYNKAVGSIEHSIIDYEKNRYKVEMKIECERNVKAPLPHISLYQDYKLNDSQDINNIVFKIKNLKMYGGSKRGLFSSFTGSGVAGYFICFSDINDTSYGCAMIENHEDKAATIRDFPLEALFDLHSTITLYLMPRTSNSFETALTLKRLIEHLPLVKENINKIHTLTIGAYIGAETDTVCRDCIADLEVESMGLYSK